MDLIYPLASILLFLAYGQAKSGGNQKFNIKVMLPLAIFLVALILLSMDDVFDVLNIGLKFPEAYWIAMMWLYPIVSFLAFFSFGHANQEETKQNNG